MTQSPSASRQLFNSCRSPPAPRDSSTGESRIPNPESRTPNPDLLDRFCDVNLFLFAELFRLLQHPRLQRVVVGDALAGGVVPDLLRQFHAAELRSAHRTEMRQLRAFRRQRFIVVGPGRNRIERQIELIVPPELEPGFRQRVIPGLGSRMAFR